MKKILNEEFDEEEEIIKYLKTMRASRVAAASAPAATTKKSAKSAREAEPLNATKDDAKEHHSIYSAQLQKDKDTDPYAITLADPTADLIFHPLTRRGIGPFLAKTFNMFTMEAWQDDGRDKCKTGEEIKQYEYQRFVREYLRQGTPYRGLLVYHGLGSGKTCSAIGAAEALFSQGGGNRKIIIMTPGSLRGNFQSQIQFCGFRHFRLENYWVRQPIISKAREGLARSSERAFSSTVEMFAQSVLRLSDDYIASLKANKDERLCAIWVPDFSKPEPNYNKLSAETQSAIRKQILNTIENTITFINYNGILAHQLKTIACDKPDFFDNAVIIIDEFHNLANLMAGKVAKYMEHQRGSRRPVDALEPVTTDRWRPKLCGTAANYERAFLFYRLLVGARNSKIIALSGTPIINEPDQIAITMNILAGYIHCAEGYLEANDETARERLRVFVREHPRLDSIFFTFAGTDRASKFRVSIFPEGYVKKFEGGSFVGLVEDETPAGQQTIQEAYEDMKNFATDNALTLRAAVSFVAHPRLPINRTMFQEKFIDTSDRDNPKIVPTTRTTLMKRMFGFISYYKGATEGVMPAIKEDVVVRVPLSGYALDYYLAKRTQEIKETPKQKKGEESEKSVSSYRFNSRAACNFAFPTSIPRPFRKRTEVSKKEVEDKGDAGEIVAEGDISLEEMQDDEKMRKAVEEEEGRIVGLEKKVAKTEKARAAAAESENDASLPDQDDESEIEWEDDEGEVEENEEEEEENENSNLDVSSFESNEEDEEEEEGDNNIEFKDEDFNNVESEEEEEEEENSDSLDIMSNTNEEEEEEEEEGTSGGGDPISLMRELKARRAAAIMTAIGGGKNEEALEAMRLLAARKKAAAAAATAATTATTATAATTAAAAPAPAPRPAAAKAAPTAEAKAAPTAAAAAAAPTVDPDMDALAAARAAKMARLAAFASPAPAAAPAPAAKPAPAAAPAPAAKPVPTAVNADAAALAAARAARVVAKPAPAAPAAPSAPADADADADAAALAAARTAKASTSIAAAADEARRLTDEANVMKIKAILTTMITATLEYNRANRKLSDNPELSKFKTLRDESKAKIDGLQARLNKYSKQSLKTAAFETATRIDKQLSRSRNQLKKHEAEFKIDPTNSNIQDSINETKINIIKFQKYLAALNKYVKNYIEEEATARFATEEMERAIRGERKRKQPARIPGAEPVISDDLDISKLKIGNYLSYETELQAALNKIRENNRKYLVLDGIGAANLENYSPKYASIIRKINEIPGSSLVYSQFNTAEGLGLLGYALEANGYTEITFKTVGGYLEFSDRTLESFNGPQENAKRFITFTGAKSLDERKTVLNLFNANIESLPPAIKRVVQASRLTNNQRGEICRVIGITGAGAEGISLKCCRAVHIMEPYWNKVRTEQVKGRAVRICSHADLPPDERDVRIYTYCTEFSQLPEDKTKLDMSVTIKTYDVSKSRDKEGHIRTSDEVILDIGERKERINSKFLNLMKRIAVDCELNFQQNDVEGCIMDVGGTIDDPAFDPDWITDLEKGKQERVLDEDAIVASREAAAVAAAGPQVGERVQKTVAAVAAGPRETALLALPGQKAKAAAAAAAAAQQAAIDAAAARLPGMPAAAAMKPGTSLQTYPLMSYRNVVYWLKPVILSTATQDRDAIIDPNKFTMHVYKRPGEQAVADPMTPPSFIIERDPVSLDKAFIPVPYVGPGAGPGGAGAKGGGEEAAQEEEEAVQAAQEEEEAVQAAQEEAQEEDA